MEGLIFGILRYPSRSRARVRQQGPLGTASTQTGQRV